MVALRTAVHSRWRHSTHRDTLDLDLSQSSHHNSFPSEICYYQPPNPSRVLTHNSTPPPSLAILTKSPRTDLLPTPSPHPPTLETPRPPTLKAPHPPTLPTPLPALPLLRPDHPQPAPPSPPTAPPPPPSLSPSIHNQTLEVYLCLHTSTITNGSPIPRIFRPGIGTVLEQCTYRFQLTVGGGVVQGGIA